MTPPEITFRSLRRSWASLEPAERNRVFGVVLTQEEQDGAWDALAHREKCRRDIELHDLAFDQGWPLDEANPDPRALLVAPRSLPRRGVAGDDIFDSIPPPVYFEALTGEAVVSGRVRCPAPGHEDVHPSCVVYDEPGRGFWCPVCEAAGSAIDLGSLITGIEPRGEGYWELRRWIAARLLGTDGLA